MDRIESDSARVFQSTSILIYSKKKKDRVFLYR